MDGLTQFEGVSTIHLNFLTNNKKKEQIFSSLVCLPIYTCHSYATNCIPSKLFYLASEGYLAGQNILRQMFTGLVWQELQEAEELGQQTQVEDHRACLFPHHVVYWVCKGRDAH